VFVDDVARAFVDCVEKPQTIGQVYELGGADRMTWPQMHQIVALAVVGHRRLTAGVPVFVAKALAAVGLGPVLGFNRDQIIMSQEDNVCELAKFIADFGWTPRAFDATVKAYAAEL
jgi:NADH dehydrogenase